MGSTNLTSGGFGGNEELVKEFRDNDGAGQHWFETLWNELEPDPGHAIALYEQAYEEANAAVSHIEQPTYRGNAPPIVPLGANAQWDAFVEGLHSRNRYCHDLVDWNDTWDEDWDVLGRTRSYLHTIGEGRQVMRLPVDHWQDLTKRQCDILLGRWTTEGEWGLIGSLTAAGHVAHVFNPQAMPDVGDIRTKIREAIENVLPPNVDDETIAESAGAVVQQIMRIHGFGPAAATRLLTLARPDRFVSINGQSAAGLAALSGLHPDPLSLAEGPKAQNERNKWVLNDYAALLGWVYTRDWFNSPEPDDDLERKIWNCRAALLDAFVYPPINPD